MLAVSQLWPIDDDDHGDDENGDDDDGDDDDDEDGDEDVDVEEEEEGATCRVAVQQRDGAAQLICCSLPLKTTPSSFILILIHILPFITITDIKKQYKMR